MQEKTLSKGQNKSVCERALMVTEPVIKKQGHFKVHYDQKTLKFSADQRVIYVRGAVEVDLQIVGIDFKIQNQPERENKAAGRQHPCKTGQGVSLEEGE